MSTLHPPFQFIFPILSYFELDRHVKKFAGKIHLKYPKSVVHKFIF